MEEVIDTSKVEILKVDAITFARNYRALEGYTNLVECIKTGKVYSGHFYGASILLIEVSNIEAIRKIEKGVDSFLQRLLKEDFGGEPNKLLSDD